MKIMLQMWWIFGKKKTAYTPIIRQSPGFFIPSLYPLLKPQSDDIFNSVANKKILGHILKYFNTIFRHLVVSSYNSNKR